MVVDVPPDIIDSIIDWLGYPLAQPRTGNLDYTFRTLRSCSLVARAWAARARMHLFCVLDIGCDVSLKNGWNQFGRFSGDMHESWDRFRSAHVGVVDPAVAKYMMSIQEFPARLAYLRHVRINGVPQKRLSPTPDLGIVTDHFCPITSLHLSRVDFAQDYAHVMSIPRIRDTQYPLFPQLQCLVLYHCYFSPAVALVQVLAHPPILKHLALENIIGEWRGTDADQRALVPILELETLLLPVASGDTVLRSDEPHDIDLRDFLAVSIRRLWLGRASRVADAPPFRNSLALPMLLVPRVHHLYCWITSSEAAHNKFLFSQFHMLETLRVDLHIRHSRADHTYVAADEPPLLSPMVDALESIPSEGLKCVYVTIQVSSWAYQHRGGYDPQTAIYKPRLAAEISRRLAFQPDFELYVQFHPTDDLVYKFNLHKALRPWVREGITSVEESKQGTGSPYDLWW